MKWLTKSSCCSDLKTERVRLLKVGAKATEIMILFGFYLLVIFIIVLYYYMYHALYFVNSVYVIS